MLLYCCGWLVRSLLGSCQCLLVLGHACTRVCLLTKMQTVLSEQVLAYVVANVYICHLSTCIKADCWPLETSGSCLPIVQGWPCMRYLWGPRMQLAGWAVSFKRPGSTTPHTLHWVLWTLPASCQTGAAGFVLNLVQIFLNNLCFQSTHGNTGAGPLMCAACGSEPDLFCM